MKDRRSAIDTKRTTLEFTLKDISIPLSLQIVAVEIPAVLKPGCLNSRTPALAWVVFRKCGALVGGLFPEILLVNDAILFEDERHDAGVSIFHRIGQKGVSAGHFSVDDVVFGATFCRGTLFSEYPVVVAVEGLRLVARVGVAERLGKVT